MDISGLIQSLRRDGLIARVSSNPRAQFGTRQRQLLGAQILPERNVPENAYKEENIRYRTVIANAATRYSPTQKKGGALVGSFLVILAESDIKSELTARDYDIIRRMLAGRPTMEAVARAIQFLDVTVNRPLIEWNERARWQALINAVVQLRGDNEYTEDVAYSNPAGHRAAAAGNWSVNTNDPMVDIFNRVQLLADKGFTVNRIVTSRKVVGIMAKNTIMASRTNRITVSAAGQIQGINGRVSLEEINGMFSAEGLPPITLYDEIYRTMTGTGRFLADNVMAFFATTGRDEAIDLGDGVIENVQNTLGYVGVGVPAGQNDAGRFIRMEHHESKPPRIEAEGWQTSLPVITEPEAIATITGIA